MLETEIRLIRLPEAAAELDVLLTRAQARDEALAAGVSNILADVRTRGDAALVEYTRRFDFPEMTIEGLRVADSEIDAAYGRIDPALLDTLRRAAANIRAFHEKQARKTWMDIGPGRTLGQLVRPLDAVGIYVPGGRAAYPSTVLMNAIPACVAGVRRIAMTTPPAKDGAVYALTLVAAREAGVTEIYRVGGAQAVAALAYGTAVIPRVDKIVGPGNAYVAEAKRQVYGQAGIDMIAGPSEVLVIADATANPAFVAADMLSQAEHDPMAAALLVTDCEALAAAVRTELSAQAARLARREIAEASLRDHGAIVVAADLEAAFEVANRVAPEHLELCIDRPFERLSLVRNAGAVFLGHYTPEPVGDYWAGPNHVLPTSGTARFSSPLNVDDFLKKTSVVFYEERSLLAAAADIERFADAEGLTAHARAVSIRREAREREANRK